VRGRLHRLTEPRYLFTGATVLVLAVIWGTTWNFADKERASARRTAAVAATDAADTYEAQVVRALREIDTTLKLVRYDLGGDTPRRVLQELRSRGLLLPDLLFTVSIADAGGNIVASTRSGLPGNISGRDFFEDTRGNDGMVIGRPRRDKATGVWWLDFSRRLNETKRHLETGVVVVSVHAGYFVSAYEPGVMGGNGVLGLLGSDGIFRARRTGGQISAGHKTDYQALVPPDGDEQAPASIEINDWDGVRRYTVARKLYEFPLAIVVGLSEAEQTAPAARIVRTYVKWAAAASLLLIAVMTLLGRLSSQLHQARNRVMEERLAHAQRVEYLAGPSFWWDRSSALPSASVSVSSRTTAKTNRH
jgi:hypothetical protein